MISASGRQIAYGNSVLLERNISGKPSTKKSISLASNDFMNESEFVRNYFRDINLNRNRTYNGPLVSEQEKEDLLAKKNILNRVFIYDAFVSTPITSLIQNSDDTEKFYRMQVITFGLQEWLKEKSLMERFYSPLTSKSYRKGGFQYMSIDEAIELKNLVGTHDQIFHNFSVSQHHILIMPFSVQSHSMIEACWTTAAYEANIRKAIFFIDKSVTFFDSLDLSSTLIVKIDMSHNIDTIIDTLNRRYFRKIANHLGRFDLFQNES